MRRVCCSKTLRNFQGREDDAAETAVRQVYPSYQPDQELSAVAAFLGERHENLVPGGLLLKFEVTPVPGRRPGFDLVSGDEQRCALRVDDRDVRDDGAVEGNRLNHLPDGGFGGVIFAALEVAKITEFYAALNLGPLMSCPGPRRP